MTDQTSHSWLHLILIEGPDPPRPGDTPSIWDTLLTWPARLVLVLGAALLGFIWSRYPFGVQFGWGLNFGLLVGVSLAVSSWHWLFLFNFGLGALWLLSAVRKPLRVRAEAMAKSTASPRPWDIADSITWLNRQAGHIEAYAVWTALTFVFWHQLTFQLSAFAALLLLAEPGLNGFVRWRLKQRRPGETPSHVAIMIERRVWIYAGTLLGFFLLAALEWRQAPALMPLVLTVVPGMLMRWLRARRRERDERTDPTQRQTRLALVERQRRAAPVGDALLGPGLAFVVTAGLCVLSLLQQHSLRERAKAGAQPAASIDNGCVAEPSGPETPTLALMLLADTQVHTLGGKRFPGQLELADSVVPVALRPVELDMLSSAALTRLGNVYKQRSADRAALKLSPPLWAHLGDFADLACVDELGRALKVLQRDLGVGSRLAGLVHGNHDGSFVGNFAWSPFWNAACDPSSGQSPSPGTLDKGTADALLSALLPGDAPNGKHDASGPLSTSKAISGLSTRWPFYHQALARVTITHLGVLPAGDAATTKPRGVVAVFLDTSDRAASDFGVPGAVGAFSAKQAQVILEQIDALRDAEADREPWVDPWFVLLGHHPYDELFGTSQKRLNDLIKRLNGDDRGRPARVLALISAHTHTAESFWHEIGLHKLREIVIGSVIDPPQQAAWLELGLDARGRATLRLSSLPTVAREGRVCSAQGSLDAGLCQRAMARLASAPECRELLTDDTSEVSCATLERELSTDQRLSALTLDATVDDPKALRAKQDQRARALLECVTRPMAPRSTPATTAGPTPQPCPEHRFDAHLLDDPLASEAYARVIDELATDDCHRLPAETSHQEELACLAWAASAVQAHKASGMTIASAIRCAFDDPSLPAAQVCVASEVP